MKDAHPAADRIAAYALLHSEKSERARLERHFASCSSWALLNILPQQTIDPLALTNVPDRETTSRETPATESALANTISYHLGFGEDHQPKNEALLASLWPTAALIAHPRYRILGFLGVGGMGVVYKAEHRLMERLVALKVIQPKLVNRPGMVERFQREVRSAARLSHPNIVAAFDAEQVGDIHFLVMEFVEGSDLEKVARSIGQFPCSLACSYARQTGLGLQHAFERGMVHRDIKPHNIMITPEGQAKILDFGLARLVSETHAPIDQDPTRSTANWMRSSSGSRSSHLRRRFLGPLKSLETTGYPLKTRKTRFVKEDGK